MNFQKYNKPLALIFVILLYVLIIPIFSSDKPQLNICYSLQTIEGAFRSLIAKVVILQHPILHINNLNQMLNDSAHRMKIPHINTLVQTSTISYYGYLPGKIIYNKLNHTPTPITISFTGWNKFAIQKNAYFFSAKNKTPQFLIEEPGTIDQRFYPVEDSLTKLNILNNFQLIYEYNNFNLLSRVTNDTGIEFKKLYTKEFNLGQEILLNDNRAEPTFVKVTLQKTLFETIITQLYKPPEYMISVKDSEKTLSKYRLVVDAAQCGFLISPIIENLIDVTAVRDSQYYKAYQDFQHSPLRSCVSLTIFSTNLKSIAAEKGTIEVFQVLNLSLGREKTKRPLPFSYLIKNLSISKEQFNQTIISEGKKFYYLPAPSSFEIDLREKNKYLEIESFMPFHTYSDGTRSDGILLSIDFQNKNKHIITEKQNIDPYNNINDRGIIKTKFKIPANCTSCAIKIMPKTNSAWDQFYISEISLLP